MKNIDEYVENLYLTDEYIIRNPSLHEEDSPWKISKIIPLVDRLIDYINADEINLLDVGGGAGLILNAVSTYIAESCGTKVNKFAVDLSPRMLEIQKKMNPDLKKALREDIRKTSLGNKEIDLALMIDVLEHVPNPQEALEEVKRISKFVIFKVPLEDNLHFRTWNFAKRGDLRQRRIETIGHINVYTFSKLRHQIEKHTGHVLDFYFTNVFDHYQNSKQYKKWGRRGKLINFVSANISKLSPKLCSLIFTDYVMILAKCY
jgi:ubiquinone/menaquinone biosynthesis C-methylase UbiE